MNDMVDEGVVLTISGRSVGGEDVLILKLLRLYIRYGGSQNWQMESIPASAEAHEKAATLIHGQDAYRKLRYENGVHRVQWVPTHEQQGRVFTAKLAVTVAHHGGGQQERTATDIRPVRTYNLPQHRVTDHRIGLTLNRFDLDTGGDIEPIVQALIAYFGGGGSDDGSMA